MTTDSGTFGWVEFAAGRARFSGSVRGADELGHETFALEVAGAERYGEIHRVFLENGNDFNLEVVAFGWPGVEWMGMPSPGMRQRFRREEESTLRALILQLIEWGRTLEVKPAFLNEYPDARFMGDVLFAPGWLLASEAGDAA